MPDLQKHIKTSAEYLEAYESISDQLVCPRVTTLFYASLHLIEAIAVVRHNHHNCDHSHRLIYLKRREFKNARGSIRYERLHDYADFARYQPQLLHITPELFQTRVYNECFLEVVNFASKWTKLDINKALAEARAELAAASA